MTLFDEELFAGDKAAAIKVCSDHLPVWIQVKTDVDGFRLDQIVQDNQKQ